MPRKDWERVSPDTYATMEAAWRELTPVASSNIAAVGHDGKALWVRFKNGSLYRYVTAGREHHDGLVAARSPGSYFLDRIRHSHVGERIE